MALSCLKNNQSQGGKMKNIKAYLEKEIKSLFPPKKISKNSEDIPDECHTSEEERFFEKMARIFKVSTI